MTPCPGSGSFACRLPSFSPYCRTPSVGGGRSAVSRSLPEPLRPNPGRSAGPGFLARCMGSSRCMCSCFLVNLWGQNLVCVHVCFECVTLCLAGLQLCFSGCFLAHSWLKLRLSVDFGLWDGFQSQFQQRRRGAGRASTGEKFVDTRSLRTGGWVQAIIVAWLFVSCNSMVN